MQEVDKNRRQFQRTFGSILQARQAIDNGAEGIDSEVDENTLATRFELAHDIVEIAVVSEGTLPRVHHSENMATPFEEELAGGIENGVAAVGWINDPQPA